MTQCPRGGGEVLIQGRVTIQEIQHSDLGRHPPLLSPPPPPFTSTPTKYLGKCKYKCKCTCKSRMGWVQHNLIKDIKAKTHLSLASIGSKRENCTTDS